MKQDIIIFSSHLDMDLIYGNLAMCGIIASVVTNERELLSVLTSRVPAFIWIDLETSLARSLIANITERFLHPPPYIILTSSFAGSAERTDMLNLGVDVCVETPVDLNEILAILNSALRREERLKYVHVSNLLPCIEHKEMQIDPLRRTVRMRSRLIQLTRKEFDLLHLLASHAGVAFTKEELCLQIWKTEYDHVTTTISDHISSLRHKLGISPKDKNYIQTIIGIGYRFADTES